MRVMPVLASVIALGSVLHCSSPDARDSYGERDASSDTTTSSSSSGAPNDTPGISNDASTDGSRVCTEDIDVVLVIDTSSTMTFVLEALEDEFENVVSASNALKDGAHFGAVFFQDNAVLDSTGAEGTVHLAHDTLRSAFTTMRTVYTRNNRNPGDGPSGPTTQNPLCEENSLDALHMAATQFPWRDNAARIAIVVTDDTFLEKPDNYGDGNGDGDTDDRFPFREGDYPAAYTVDETVAALNEAGVKVFSFSLVNPHSSCGTSRRHSEGVQSVTFGWTQPYAGKAPIPDQTGGKNFDLDQVSSGTLHLDEAINGIVLETRCGGVN